MYKFVKQMRDELENYKNLGTPSFEIEIIGLDGERDWLLCDISFKGNSLIAERCAVTTKESNSKLVATSKIVCDSSLGLDSHLQELYDEVVNDIYNGDLFEIHYG